jgi:TorA maturation chaperone TorD
VTELVTRPGEVQPGGADRLARAELLNCLSRAFLPPPPDWGIAEWGGLLSDDLRELGEATGLDTRAAVRALDAAIEASRADAARGGGSRWLVEYSGLFLVPPVKVTLNAGVYLDGALGGASTQMVRSCYETAGFAPAEDFRDLPDHVAMQLEFVARLEERAAGGDDDAAAMAGEFCAMFIDGWAEPLERACLAAADRAAAARVYAALARLVRVAAGDDTATRPVSPPAG